MHDPMLVLNMSIFTVGNGGIELSIPSRLMSTGRDESHATPSHQRVRRREQRV